MKSSVFLLLVWLLLSPSAHAQNVGIGTAAPNASAQLDVSSTSKGLLLPRMTTIQRKAIANPANGLLVYDLDKRTIYLYDGSQWTPMLFATSENQLPPVAAHATGLNDTAGLGASVSLSGNYALVGAAYKTINGHRLQGSVYVFFHTNGSWVQQAEITSADGTANDHFGLSVSLSGDQAVIGAVLKDVGTNTGEGCAYIFARNGTTWVQQQKLVPADGAAGDNFGRSVSISGNYIAIGSNFHQEGSNASQGSAYMYVRSGSSWVFQTRVTSANGSANDYFGMSVALSTGGANGDLLVIGAPFENKLGLADEGAVYIFQRSGANWTQLARLEDPVGGIQNNFGYAISISGDYIAAYGSGGNTGTDAEKGHVCIFYRGDGWVSNQHEQAVLYAIDGMAYDYFGNSVHLSTGNNGDLLVAGAPGYDPTGTTVINYGGAYIFRRNGTTWQFVRKLREGDEFGDNYFGTSVFTDGTTIAIGSQGKDNFKGEISFLDLQ